MLKASLAQCTDHATPFWVSFLSMLTSIIIQLNLLNAIGIKHNLFSWVSKTILHKPFAKYKQYKRQKTQVRLNNALRHNEFPKVIEIATANKSKEKDKNDDAGDKSNTNGKDKDSTLLFECVSGVYVMKKSESKENRQDNVNTIYYVSTHRLFNKYNFIIRYDKYSKQWILSIDCKDYKFHPIGFIMGDGSNNTYNYDYNNNVSMLNSLLFGRWYFFNSMQLNSNFNHVINGMLINKYTSDHSDYLSYCENFLKCVIEDEHFDNNSKNQNDYNINGVCYCNISIVSPISNNTLLNYYYNYYTYQLIHDHHNNAYDQAVTTDQQKELELQIDMANNYSNINKFQNVNNFGSGANMRMHDELDVKDDRESKNEMEYKDPSINNHDNPNHHDQLRVDNGYVYVINNHELKFEFLKDDVYGLNINLNSNSIANDNDSNINSKYNINRSFGLISKQRMHHLLELFKLLILYHKFNMLHFNRRPFYYIDKLFSFYDNDNKEKDQEKDQQATAKDKSKSKNKNNKNKNVNHKNKKDMSKKKSKKRMCRVTVDFQQPYARIHTNYNCNHGNVNEYSTCYFKFINFLVNSLHINLRYISWLVSKDMYAQLNKLSNSQCEKILEIFNMNMNSTVCNIYVENHFINIVYNYIDNLSLQNPHMFKYYAKQRKSKYMYTNRRRKRRDSWPPSKTENKQIKTNIFDLLPSSIPTPVKIKTFSPHYIGMNHSIATGIHIDINFYFNNLVSRLIVLKQYKMILYKFLYFGLIVLNILEYYAMFYKLDKIKKQNDIDNGWFEYQCFSILAYNNGNVNDLIVCFLLFKTNPEGKLKMLSLFHLITTLLRVAYIYMVMSAMMTHLYPFLCIFLGLLTYLVFMILTNAWDDESSETDQSNNDRDAHMQWGYIIFKYTVLVLFVLMFVISLPMDKIIYQMSLLYYGKNWWKCCLSLFTDTPSWTNYTHHVNEIFQSGNIIDILQFIHKWI